MSLFKKRVAAIILALTLLMPYGMAHAESNKYSTIGSAIASGLQGWYNENNGLWDSTGWWNSANALEAIIDYSSQSGSTEFLHVIANTYEKHQAGNFLNHYYDDEGWWALAWIKAYDLTKEQRYLDMAKTIFEDMKGAWDSICSGGVWWNKDRSYKNAITNELFLTIAARLHQRTPGDAGEGSYLDWAEKEWAWFQSSGMINSDNLVNDGLNNTCSNNGDVTWTYNQGVILGGLIELSKIKGDAQYLNTAKAIADAAITTLVNSDGILQEPCDENGCGGDGPSFKGIFMRNLNYLYDTTHDIKYRKFIEKSVDSLWANRNSLNQIGVKWYAPADTFSAASQHSALDAVNGLVKKVPTGSSALLNVAPGGSATSSEPCDAAQGPINAIDGKVKPSSKFCTQAADKWLQVDLGAQYKLSEFAVYHAGAAGDDLALNTKSYNIQISQDGIHWTKVAERSGNTANVTTHHILQTSARYVKLNITDTASNPAIIAEFAIYGEPSPDGPNLALYKAGSGSQSCAASEGPEKAFDGAFKQNSKFCSGSPEKWLQVDLGSSVEVSKFVIKHAGFGGENPKWNTRDYSILVSEDGTTWSAVVQAADNAASETSHSITPVLARYVKLAITNAGSDNVTRIYEVEVYGGQ
ncbi:glycoside hydrolase family 76 protein [Paenibacillus spongiae]|uniref:Discoidin domain-containing protein n=1 Tax=Paenibacillus spongiae TaxID=2909671 RepID=A0ABY5S5V9_9BACL|nr:glycoside hydrolase family 76 protein [Paenibacillus spongiae]UVI29089.1 discoidin domain-containing protein [Paenibacillus spongiae]